MATTTRSKRPKATDWQGKKPPTKGQNLFIKMVRALPTKGKK